MEFTFETAYNAKNHAQLYDKTHLQGGTPEDFRRFIEEKTNKQTVQVT